MLGKKITLGSRLEKIVDVLAEIAGFLTVVLIVLLYINGVCGNFLGDATPILTVVREIAILLTVALVGLEFVIDKGFFLFLIYAALIVTAVVFMFFPGAIPGLA